MITTKPTEITKIDFEVPSNHGVGSGWSKLGFIDFFAQSPTRSQAFVAKLDSRDSGSRFKTVTKPFAADGREEMIA